MEAAHDYPLDRMVHAAMARATAGISPAALLLACADWLFHLAIAPEKRLELTGKAARKALRLATYACGKALDPTLAPCIAPLPQDTRFAAPEWNAWPYDLLHQGFLLAQQWWWAATTGVRGVSRHHEEVVWFTARQWLDVFSPSNFPPTNPEVIRATLEEGGANLVRGLCNAVEDAQRARRGDKPVGADTFALGRDVAATPGKVVLRNRLIELIQYAPSTAQVHAEPVLIVPAWIMKYYVLDLTPHDSLVKYLRDHGHTVFMVSWKNPTEEDRDLGMDDYRRLGVTAALEAIRAIVPQRRVHAVGYCLGGTLLALAAAAMRGTDDAGLQSLTLLAAQTDFDEAGELMLFIDESQLTYLEDMMWSQGYLDTGQMAGAFQLLRSNDLIWSRLVRDYLLGRRQPMSALMAWNADATRMPYRMHAEYLRHLFLDNDFAHGRYEVDGRSIAITDIRVPIFAVGTERDHVAPWRSVYKINLLSDTDVTFLLSSGGHNAGIVSEPGRPGRRYRIATKREGECCYLDAETWLANTPVRQGSWWPEWQAWLAAHASGRAQAPELGAPDRGYPPLGDAPGTYVLQP